jgi:hypothetical protein
MTRLKVISAALIAAAMLATPAVARSSHVTYSRLFEEGSNATARSTARYFDGHVGVSDPQVNALPTPPDGENCDVGDNPRVC